MKLKYNPIVKPEVLDKLDSYVDFMANVSESAAIQILREYKKTLNSISENPHSGLNYPHKSHKNLKYKLFYKRRYRVVFEIIENNVYIYDIQDCRQDTDKNLI